MPRLPFAMLALIAIWLTGSVPSLAAGSKTDAIPYASSGIGDDDPLESLADDYNLQLVFATQGGGEYLADIRVLIADLKGNTLLDAESPGPLFFVRLPAGTYRINADFHGTPLRKSLAVSGRHHQTLYFHWPREAVETDTRRP